MRETIYPVNILKTDIELLRKQRILPGKVCRYSFLFVLIV